MLEFDGMKLKELRKGQNLKQKDLGVMVGKKQGHIANYENGVATPPSDTLLSLMEIFKVSAKDLGKAKDG